MNMQKLLNAFDRENDHKVAMQHFFKTLKEKGIPMPNGFHYICSPLMFFYLPCTQEQVSVLFHGLLAINALLNQWLAGHAVL